MSTSLRQIVADELDFPFGKMNSGRHGQHRRSGADLWQPDDQTRWRSIAPGGCPSEGNAFVARGSAGGSVDHRRWRHCRPKRRRQEIDLRRSAQRRPGGDRQCDLQRIGRLRAVPFTRSGSKRPSLDRPEDSTDQKKPGRLSGGRAVPFTAAMLTAVVIELSLILPELPPVSL